MPPDPTPALRIILDGAEAEQVRDAIARFALDNAAKIRAIARVKLTKVTRTVHDSEDVLSSVVRRLDGLAIEGRLRPASEKELWRLIAVIARNCAVSKTRLIERAQKLLTEDGPLAYEAVRRLNSCRSDEEATLLVSRMIGTLRNSQDRQILDLLMRGASNGAIAALMGISMEASRQRLTAIRRKLRVWLDDQGAKP